MIKKLLALSFFIGYTITTTAQDFSLFNQFYGHYDFTMIGNTLNPNANSSSNTICALLPSSSADLNLTSDQKVKAAYLYWSGPGTPNTADVNVRLNAVEINSERTYFVAFSTSSGPLGIFGAFADVTDLVKEQKNTNYTFSDLSFSNSTLMHYCANGINYAGWAIIVIYEQESLPKNLVTVYDGFKGIEGSNPVQTVLLDGFEITDVNDSKIGFLAWEGDALISNEELRINNLVASNALNPPNNPFNSTNSFTNSNQLWNMDLDYYMLDNYVDVGDTSLKVQVSTAGDVIILHGIALSFGSKLPDATIKIDEIKSKCFTRIFDLHYTVSNTNGEHLLLQGTPIAFYIGDELIGTDILSEDVPIGGSLSDNITLTSADYYGVKFEITAVVDDDGTGKGKIFEIDENNNSDLKLVNLFGDDCYIPRGISPNGDGKNDGFDLEVFYLDNLKIYNRYGNLVYEHGEGYTNQWEGQDNKDRLLPAGTYFYVFTTAYDTYSGYVQLIREIR